tara:strand:+ start:1592 stop:2371 length:780 start_codon:yes stop_codon:yes gene_type:complete
MIIRTTIILAFSLLFSQDCEPGYAEINGLCFHEGDLSVIQKMIDNSYASGIDLGCQDGDSYCGSPNPYMDDQDAWFWVYFDGEYYEWPGDDSGFVDPLELGLQEWNNGRLTSLMCGAYIYCQLSGPIPEEINQLTEATVLRFEYNYLSGFIPETICDLPINNNDYLEFDLSGNRLCPPYPDCSGEGGSFWYQETSACTEIGDINFDANTNILDIIVLVSFVLQEAYPDYQELIASDMNSDGSLDVLDIVAIVDAILQID